MTITKNTPQTHIDAVGLLANGSSGPGSIDIDETLSGADRWFAQIEGPSIYCYFEIPSIEIVGKMVRFLESRPVLNSIDSNDGASSLAIGKDKTTPVVLIKDDEYDDRFFLAVGSTDCTRIRFVINGADLENIANALRQVEQELNEE